MQQFEIKGFKTQPVLLGDQLLKLLKYNSLLKQFLFLVLGSFTTEATKGWEKISMETMLAKRHPRLNLDPTEMALKDHMMCAQKPPVQLCDKKVSLSTNLDSPKFLC